MTTMRRLLHLATRARRGACEQFIAFTVPGDNSPDEAVRLCAQYCAVERIELVSERHSYEAWQAIETDGPVVTAVDLGEWLRGRVGLAEGEETGR